MTFLGKQACHAGECLPCRKTSTRSCQCGKMKTVRNCNELNFQCDQVIRICKIKNNNFKQIDLF